MNYKVKIAKAWKEQKKWLYLLWPAAKIYQNLIVLRKQLYKKKILKSWQFNIPIIVVGNITVGGTGKTSIVIWLAKALQKIGYEPAIITRGYQSHIKNYPHQVGITENAAKTGDEPLLIAKHSNCPVVIDPDRVRGVKFILKNFSCDVIISDDGLQHYRMARDLEICLIDENEKFGNGVCLPAGPLREPLSRLNEVDFLLFKKTSEKIKTRDEKNYMKGIAKNIEQFDFSYQPIQYRQVKNPEHTKPLEIFFEEDVIVMTGIAKPEHFIHTVKPQVRSIKTQLYPDHHPFQPQNFKGLEHKIILMTEKDAIKCREFAPENCWYLEIHISIEPNFLSKVIKKIGQKKNSEGAINA